MVKDNFPLEIYIKLENAEYHVGRITINLISSKYVAEIDIIAKENHKIFKHVGILYDLPSLEEAESYAVNELAAALLSKK